jgi:nucleoside-diphosphate-sugar epimerase
MSGAEADRTTRPVLVTGGAGFAGSYLVAELCARGHRVVCFDLADFRPESRFVIGSWSSEVLLERGSIDDWPRVVEVVLAHRPRAIVHAGGIMDTAFLDRHPTVAFTTNLGGTLNFLEAARLVGGVERFIFFSTIAVVGRVLYEPIDANHPTMSARDGPLGAYSAAKAAGEAFCLTYTQSFGLDTRIVRPSALYGFGMSWFAPNYMKNIVEPALAGQPVRFRTGGQVPRDYTHAADLASLVAAILEGPDDADRVFFGATGRPLRTASDVGAIVQELVPEAEIDIGDEWTEVDRLELPIRGRYSIENARTAYQWEPRFAELRDGIVNYIERYRAFVEAGGTPTPLPLGLEGAPGQAS